VVVPTTSPVTARVIERSRLGYGFATIRDDELAAEASGVPTLRVKLIATAHTAALTQGFFSDASRRLGEALHRWIQGQKPDNLVVP